MSLKWKLFGAARYLADRAGYRLYMAPKNPPARTPYAAVFPVTTYAPWLTDAGFRKVFAAIEPFTLVDQYRCYELWQLLAEVGHVPGSVLEVGTWRGGTGALLACRAEQLGRRGITYLCDTFTGVVKAGSHDTTYKGGEHADATAIQVQQVLGRVGARRAELLTGIFPEETGHLIENQEFAFGHIDVDVYQSAADVLAWLWPRLAVGGLVVFDDYGFRSCDGITRLVNEHRGRPDARIIHNLNGHAVLVKVSPEEK